MLRIPSHQKKAKRHFLLCEICAQCVFRDEVGEMFGHAYDGYLRYAYPYDELRPLSCDGVDTWGSYSLTVIDALDTLAVVGNHSEFRRSATPFFRFMFLLFLPVKRSSIVF